MSADRVSVYASLPAAIRELLERSREFARRRSLEFYVVGGFVRDRLLGLPAADVDLVWVGDLDPAELSAEYAQHLGSASSFRPAFLTAACEFAGIQVDLGRARAETYREPAALPDVRPGTLAEDLGRRDFAVNAMAWPLTAALAPEASVSSLIDPCGGRADLESGVLRVLHAASFIDDPTRILRGLELCARRDFRLSKETQELAHASIRAGRFARLSAARLRNELARLFSNPRTAVGGARGVRSLEIDKELASGFRIDEQGLVRLGLFSKEVLAASAGAGPPAWVVALTLLAWESSPAVRGSLADRLGLGRRARDLLVEGPPRLRHLLDRLAAVDWSVMEVARACAELSAIELRVLRSLAGREAGARMAEVEERMSIGLGIGGDDLLAAGVTAGPMIRLALDRTLEARRAGEVGAEAELEFALDWLRKQNGKGDAG